MKKIIKKIFKTLGYQIYKVNTPIVVQAANDAFSMQAGLNRCVSRGLTINTVIDIGASDGRWSENCMKQLPTSNYLLIEAQEGHLEGLIQCRDRNSKLDFVLAAAGRNDGKIYFDNGNLLGGLASEIPFEENCIEVPVISVDKEVARRDLKAPYLLKLDTHGFEVPILEGAKEVIQSAELIIIEAYNFQLTKDSLKFWEMCYYMEKLGFLPIELVDLMSRKIDAAFWQMDIFFVPAKSPLLLINKYDHT